VGATALAVVPTAIDAGPGRPAFFMVPAGGARLDRVASAGACRLTVDAGRSASRSPLPVALAGRPVPVAPFFINLTRDAGIMAEYGCVN